MKRATALRHLRVICERLGAADPASFFVIPVRLYLFGSVLTDKAEPADVDLVFEFKDRPDQDAQDIVYRMSYGKPLPHEQAMSFLRRGMKGMHLEPLQCRPSGWLQEHGFPPDTDVRLLWEPGFDWAGATADVEAHPAPWDPAREAWNKAVQQEASGPMARGALRNVTIPK